MKSKEKPDDILRNYKYYLKLEKSLSLNTVNAYLTDLNKLVSFLSEENVHILDVTLEHLETFSAGLRDLGICPKSQARILSGIRDGKDLLKAKEIRHLHDNKYALVLMEGKNREIRRMMEACRKETKRLKRIAVGSLYMKDLPAGLARRLSAGEVALVLKDMIKR